jgi:hypothetical protein
MVMRVFVCFVFDDQKQIHILTVHHLAPQLRSCYSSCSRKHAFVTLENKRESPNANAAKVGRKMAMSSYIMFVSVFGH